MRILNIKKMGFFPILYMCTTAVAKQLAREDYTVPPLYMQGQTPAVGSCCCFHLHGSKWYLGTRIFSARCAAGLMSLLV